MAQGRTAGRGRCRVTAAVTSPPASAYPPDHEAYRAYARPRPLIRHFDTPRVARLVHAYAEVQGLAEVGIDFVARPFHVYYWQLERWAAGS